MGLRFATVEPSISLEWWGVSADIERHARCLRKRCDDAYHSLSIEGYGVSPELIERVRSNTWNPETNEQDRRQRDARAALGYWQAYQTVQKSLGRVLNGENPGSVADEDHGTW